MVATFFPELLPAGTVNVYYEAAAVIVTLILFGRYLEARAKGSASEAIKTLLDLQPKTAQRVRTAADMAAFAQRLYGVKLSDAQNALRSKVDHDR